MRLRFTARATQDLIDIADYFKERDPAASLRVRTAILNSLQSLTLFPEGGRRQTVNDVREFVTRQYRYIVYDSIERASEQILVLAIQHPARKREHDDA
jgi:toxin ParE1/3/4